MLPEEIEQIEMIEELDGWKIVNSPNDINKANIEAIKEYKMNKYN